MWKLILKVITFARMYHIKVFWIYILFLQALKKYHLSKGHIIIYCCQIRNPHITSPPCYVISHKAIQIHKQKNLLIAFYRIYWCRAFSSYAPVYICNKVNLKYNYIQQGFSHLQRHHFLLNYSYHRTSISPYSTFFFVSCRNRIISFISFVALSQP